MSHRFAFPSSIPVALFLAVVSSTVPAADPVPEAQLFERACGQCHPSSRIFLVNLDREKRRHVVEHMRNRWEGGEYALPDTDVQRLLDYIDERARAGDAARPTAQASAKDLFRERCAGCHELDRVYARAKAERGKPAAWLHVVTRMRGKSPDWISEEDAQRIVEYLRERTTPKTQAPPAVAK